MRAAREPVEVRDELQRHARVDRRGVRQTIVRLEDEFAAIDSMLVLYPTGEALTLEQGTRLLRQQTGEI